MLFINSVFPLLAERIPVNWYPELLEEAKIKDIVDQLPKMLKNHMERFQSCFNRSEQKFNGNIYVKGLLGNFVFMII